MAACEHCGEEHEAADVYCPRTGQLMAERLLPRHTMLEGKYLIDAPIGVGGMGAVFSATHTLLDKKVAIKVMLTADQQATARLVREARAASATGHPNIAAVTDMGKTPGGALFVVMEFLAGKTLKELLERKPLGPRRALRLTAQILAGLEVVHQKGIIHRDLKPDNLMLVCDAEGEEMVKILDFGISKVLSEDNDKLHLTDTGLVMGTPLYMSPEQARADESIGAPTDVYAVGAILYAMLCGQPPHVAETLASLISAKLEQPPMPPSRRDESLPPAIDAVVLKALAQSTAERYPDATAMRRDVLALLGDDVASTRRSSPGLAAPVEASGFEALDSLPAFDGGESLEDFGLVTLDEASQGSGIGAVTARDASLGGATGVPLAPVATSSDRALPRRPAEAGPRELELDDASVGAAKLELEPLATPPRERQVGGFPREGAVAGVAYAGQARRRRGGVVRLLLWLIVLGGLGAGGYWGYQRYLQGDFSGDVMISIDTRPAGAQVIVDGMPVRTQPLVFKRSQRTFEVVVKAKGYEVGRASFTPDRDQTLRVDLVPLGKAAKSKKKRPTRKKRPKRRRRRSKGKAKKK